MLQRVIPSSGESLPVIGLGTWQTFDVEDAGNYPALLEVLQYFHAGGGRLIDSSPMYGRAEEVIGNITSSMDKGDDFFYATKVWTTGLQDGTRQIETSFRKMQRTCINLVQIHNLVDWKTHLPQLRRMKDQGKIRYIGITHYTDDSHEELENIMRKEPLDFVQFNYAINAPHAEKRLLACAADLGVATLVNRPLGQGNLFKIVYGKPLPAWAGEMGIASWAVYFLKYILAHEAVTCVIPATKNPTHVRELLAAGEGLIPDQFLKAKMKKYLETL